MRPDVSVLMAVHNGLTNYPRGQLRKAIETTQEQGVDLEFCIVDDGSTDGTWEWLAHSGRPWRKAVLVRHSDRRGPAATYQIAANVSSGRYCILQSVRSWFDFDVLRRMRNALDDAPDVGFVYGQTQYHGASRQRHIPPPFDAKRFYSHFDSLFGYMYRREALDRGCQYQSYIERDELNIDICDYDFMMQLIAGGWKGLALRETLCLHYLYSGEGQMTNHVHKYQSEIDAIFQSRWGVV